MRVSTFLLPVLAFALGAFAARCGSSGSDKPPPIVTAAGGVGAVASSVGGATSLGTAGHSMGVGGSPQNSGGSSSLVGSGGATSGTGDSAAQLSCNALLGFGLPASTGKPFVDKLWSAAIPTGNWRYYDGTLYVLGLLHVSGTFKLWY